MHIMFVDDNPYSKVNHLISFLKENNIEFTSVLHGNANSAMRYIFEHGNEIDLAVIDLGLPMFGDGSGYHEVRGLDIIDEIRRKYPNIPVIISSTTAVPREKMDHYAKKLTIKHCRPLDGKTLLNFTKKGFIHLIEPNFVNSGKFVFWIDSEEDSLVKKYSDLFRLNISKLMKEVPNSDASVTVLSNNKIILTCKDDSDLFSHLEYIIRFNEYHEVYMKLFEEELLH